MGFLRVEYEREYRYSGRNSAPNLLFSTSFANITGCLRVQLCRWNCVTWKYYLFWVWNWSEWTMISFRDWSINRHVEWNNAPWAFYRWGSLIVFNYQNCDYSPFSFKKRVNLPQWYVPNMYYRASALYLWLWESYFYSVSFRFLLRSYLFRLFSTTCEPMDMRYLL